MFLFIVFLAFSNFKQPGKGAGVKVRAQPAAVFEAFTTIQKSVF